MKTAEHLERLKTLEQQMTQEISDTMLELEAERLSLVSTQNDLQIREQNVIRMEKSIRDHMQKRSELEEKLSDANSQQNVTYMQVQVLEGEKQDLQRDLHMAEERINELRKQLDETEKKCMELSLQNQKLQRDKTVLLSQVTGGQNSEEK